MNMFGHWSLVLWITLTCCLIIEVPLTYSGEIKWKYFFGSPSCNRKKQKNWIILSLRGKFTSEWNFFLGRHVTLFLSHLVSLSDFQRYTLQTVFFYLSLIFIPRNLFIQPVFLMKCLWETYAYLLSFESSDFRYAYFEGWFELNMERLEFCKHIIHLVKLILLVELKFVSSFLTTLL